MMNHSSLITLTHSSAFGLSMRSSSCCSALIAVTTCDQRRHMIDHHWLTGSSQCPPAHCSSPAVYSDCFKLRNLDFSCLVKQTSSHTRWAERCVPTASALIKNMPCCEKSKVRTTLLKDSPLPLPAENFNFPHESQVAQHDCVQHPVLWVETEAKLAPTVQVSKMVSVSPWGRLSITAEFLQTSHTATLLSGCFWNYCGCSKTITSPHTESSKWNLSWVPHWGYLCRRTHLKTIASQGCEYV